MKLLYWLVICPRLLHAVIVSNVAASDGESGSLNRGRGAALSGGLVMLVASPAIRPGNN